MPGLDPKVATHKLAVRPDKKPVKQAQWRARPELPQESSPGIQSQLQNQENRLERGYQLLGFR